MRVSSVSTNSKSVNSKALLSIKNAGRFNPTQSESSYKLIESFKTRSWGIQTLCKKFDVKAVFTTLWFNSHPLYTPETKEKASYAQMDLFVREPLQEKGLIAKIRHYFKPWNKISYGEYSDFRARNPLSDAEEKLAFVIRNLDYATLRGNFMPEDSTDVIVDSAREMRKFYHQ